MKSPYDIILSSVVTERSTKLTEQEQNPKYTFVVADDASKIDIERAVQSVFRVNVQKVNIINQHGKMKRLRARRGRTSSFKKAIVTLSPGERIDFA